MKARLYVYLVGLAIAATIIGGCSQSPAGLSLNQIVANDVNNARLMSKAAGDPLAEKCWTYLQEVSSANATNSGSEGGKVVGVLSAYQKARTARRRGFNLDLSDDFKLNCGPMLIDSAGAMRRLGLKIAVPFL